MKCVVPKSINTEAHIGWCPGCGHGMLVISGIAHTIFSLMALLFIRSYPLTLVCFFLMGISSTLGFWSPVFKAVSMAGSAESKDEPKKKATAKEIFSVLKMPKVWMFALLVFGVYGFYCGSSYLTPYFSTVLGVSVVFSGTLATLKNYGTRLAGAPIAGIICDKIGRLKFLSIAAFVTIVLMIAFILMPASSSALIPIMVLMFALALVNVAMKGVQFSALDEIGVDRSVNGMAISIASLIGFNLPDVALHPIFGAILDANEPVAAYEHRKIRRKSRNSDRRRQRHRRSRGKEARP